MRVLPGVLVPVFTSLFISLSLISPAEILEPVLITEVVERSTLVTPSCDIKAVAFEATAYSGGGQ